MLICFIYKNSVVASLKQLHQHLKLVHNIYERHERYTCCQNNCRRAFCGKFSLNNQIESYHSECIANNIVENKFNKSASEQFNSVSDIASINDYDDFQSTVDTSVHPVIDVKELACKFISKAKSRVSTLQNVCNMIHACSAMQQILLGALLKILKLYLTSITINQIYKKIA